MGTRINPGDKARIAEKARDAGKEGTYLGDMIMGGVEYANIELVEDDGLKQIIVQKEDIERIS